MQGIKTLPDDQAEVAIYVVEQSPNGTSSSIPATMQCAHF
ncbi:rCG52980 [Rattus norvegicus]|uniref:RCG52980 n=1 Tax=Rattus norvegicus TaxID=10116 RepID=A6IQW5_RAT|nr:rCG52980 [Rattus norvegicus]